MSRKRSFTNIANTVNSIGDPPNKMRKVQTEDIAQQNIPIFDVLNVRYTILDYLAFSYENISFLIHISDNSYLKRRLLTLNKNEIIKIKNNVEKSFNDPREYNFYFLCIFYANFKLLFDEHALNLLVNIPISKLSAIGMSDKSQSINDPLSITISSSAVAYTCNNLKYFTNIGIKLNSFKDLSDLFDQNQQLFLKTHTINFTKCNSIRFKMSESFRSNSDSDELDFTYEILANNTRTADRNPFNMFCVFGFEFQKLQLKPTIVTIPVWKNYNETKRFHTNALLPSVERIFVLRNVGSYDDVESKHDSNPFILHLDHNRNHKLNKIFVCGKNDHDFNVNIKYYKNSICQHCDISNMNEKCDISSNLFEIFSLKIRKIEQNFITNCNGFMNVNLMEELNDLSVNYNDFVIKNGLINVGFNNDIYHFKINENLELVLEGWTVTDFEEDYYTDIVTSDIPNHWIKMNIGGTFCPIKAILGENQRDNDVIGVHMESFSNNMLEFSINRSTITFFSTMDYNSIPNNMKFIRLPYGNYDYMIKDNLSFLVNKSLSINDLPYKQIEFKFYESLFSDTVKIQYSDDEEQENDEMEMNDITQEIDEYGLEKLLNPVFNTKFDGDNIVVYHRK